MRKSLFRMMDRFELLCCYALCFLFNILLDYARTAPSESHLLQIFFLQFYDHQAILVFMLSWIVVIFHYKMLHRRRIEVRCRVLVGDTRRALASRYFVECLIIAGISFAGATLAALAMRLGAVHNACLLCVLFAYIGITSRMVYRFENI